MLQQAVKELNMETEIETWVDERGVVVSISEQMLFDEGSARIHPEARRVLSKIGGVLELLPNDLAIEGHTDPERPLNSVYGDNWGLSSARAAAVTSYLNESVGLAAKRLRAVGLGWTSPKIPNDSPANMRLNRRVDIIIMSEHSVR
jgi:chemotaxis protein MotB